MPNLTQVTLAAGSPTDSGTVSTIDALIAIIATASAQGTTNAALANILANLTPDPATQTTLAAVLAKLTADPATQTTLAAILAKLATANIIGGVRIDQTTDGTTNKVAADVRLGGVAAATGLGVAGATVQRVVLASDSAGITAPGQTTMSASMPVTMASDQGAIKTNAVASATANGTTLSRINAAATTNTTPVKTSAGQIYSLSVYNVASYTVFLKLFNKASAPTLGTDTPVWTIPIPAGGGFSKVWPMGVPFATGISYAITKLQADSDTTVVVAGDATGQIMWI